MGYSLPTFNLPVRVWRSTSLVTDPPDVTTAGNLVGSRPEVVSLPAMGNMTLSQRQVTVAYWGRFSTILLPKLADVRPPNATDDGDVIECPSGTGRYYFVVHVDDTGKGFPNEHRYAFVVAIQTPAMVGLLANPCGITSPWPVPIP